MQCERFSCNEFIDSRPNTFQPYIFTYKNIMNLIASKYHFQYVFNFSLDSNCAWMGDVLPYALLDFGFIEKDQLLNMHLLLSFSFWRVEVAAYCLYCHRFSQDFYGVQRILLDLLERQIGPRSLTSRNGFWSSLLFVELKLLDIKCYGYLTFFEIEKSTDLSAQEWCPSEVENDALGFFESAWENVHLDPSTFPRT